MKYNVDEQVRLKSKGNLGTIKRYKIEGGTNKQGKEYYQVQYLVKFEQGTQTWFYESSLDPAYDKEFDLELNELLTDINLKHGNFHYVELLRKQREELEA